MTGDELSKALLANTENGVTIQIVQQPLMSPEVQAYVNELRKEIFHLSNELTECNRMSMSLLASVSSHRDSLRECCRQLADDDWPYHSVAHQTQWLKRAKELIEQ